MKPYQDHSGKSYHMLVPEKYLKGRAALRAEQSRISEGSQVMTYVKAGIHL